MEENLNAEQIINSVNPNDDIIQREINREDLFDESFKETDTDSNYTEDVVNNESYDNPSEEESEEEYDVGDDEELFRENPLKALWVLTNELKDMLYDLEDRFNDN